MGSIDNYIIRSTLSAFVLVLLTLTAVIWMTQALRGIDLMTNQGQTILVFLSVTGLTVKDFHLLVQLKVFNTEQMNQAVFAFRRYEDASLSYTGIESHAGLSRYGLYDTVVARD